MAAEVRGRIRSAWAAEQGESKGKGRTVAELRGRSLAVREERRAKEAKRKEAEQLRKAEEAKRAQRARMDVLKLQGTRVWNEVEREINRMHASGYDRTLGLLVDLRALVEESRTGNDFAERIQSIRERHFPKWKFIERLDSHRLGLG